MQEFWANVVLKKQIEAALLRIISMETSHFPSKPTSAMFQLSVLPGPRDFTLSSRLTARLFAVTDSTVCKNKNEQNIQKRQYNAQMNVCLFCFWCFLKDPSFAVIVSKNQDYSIACWIIPFPMKRWVQLHLTNIVINITDTAKHSIMFFTNT